MKLESKFDIGQVVYIKSRNGCSKGTISAIGLDPSKQTSDSFTFVYLIWESDRLDNAGHHIWAYEGNIGLTFDDAYYNANNRFGWDITEDLKAKDIQLQMKKIKASDSSILPEVIV